MIITYPIHEVTQHINWVYFFHAWGFKRSLIDKTPEAGQLRKEANEMLELLDKEYTVKSICQLHKANADGDNIILDDTTLLPLLRQQTRKHANAPFLCLSDFVRPLSSGIADTVGVFATSVDRRTELLYPDDPYKRLLVQTLADRLAEAATEKMYTGLCREKGFGGIRPAVGYPSLPDQSIIFILDKLMHLNRIGITLTESGAMIPCASTCGLIITHPKAFYFAVGEINEEQLRDYARRRGVEVDQVRRLWR